MSIAPKAKTAAWGDDPAASGARNMRIRAVQAALIVVLASTLAYTVNEGRVDDTRSIGTVVCLGCLGLDPVVADFDGYWTAYPAGNTKAGQTVEHPQWVLDELDRYDMVFLFFWYVGCIPCKEQWHEMEGDKLVVSGSNDQSPEDGGRAGPLYGDRVLVVPLDSIASERGQDAMSIYHPVGLEPFGAPQTTLILRDSHGQVWWFSQSGRMASSDVQTIIEYGFNLQHGSGV